MLPGEERDEEEDLNAEVVVVEWLTEVGRVEEGLWDGERTESVWRSLVGGGVSGEDLYAIARWAHVHVTACEWRVMDPYCVELVRKIWSVRDDLM